MLSETPKEEVEPATGAGVGRSIQSSGNYRSHSFGWKGLGGSKGWKEGRTGVDRERTARGTDGSGEIRGDYGRRWLGRDGDAGCRDRDRAEGGREEGRGGETEIMKGPTAAQERGTDE